MFFNSKSDKNKSNDFIPYKFAGLKSYCTTEWLVGKKKYRRVFERNETAYLYGELSFYNKLFDEQDDWDAHIKLKCFKIGDEKKEICEIKKEITVSKSENIVYVREGWGNETQGTFWKRGDYIWEAYINDKLLGTSNFYIEDGGVITPEHNPYFDISDVKLFEGPGTCPKENDRVFYSVFNSQETRYVWVAFTLINRQEKDWFCELIFNFYNDAGQLKGQTTELKLIKKETHNKTVTICSGWGSEKGGSWFADNYRIEVVFMDHLLAISSFSADETFVKGTPNYTKPNFKGDVHHVIPTTEKKESAKENIVRLEELIGLSEIKQRIKDYAQYLEFLKLRKEQGLEGDVKFKLHSVFTGNPGTGKTTVARLLGKIYMSLGLLSKGHVHEVDRADLVGEFIGQTAPRVKKTIEKARGGILFIDEAYALSREGDSSRDYGKEVIEILLKEMSDGPGDIVVMAAGYPDEMNTFLSSNPGLKSRFNQYYHFTDYTPDELMEIANLNISKKKLHISDEAKEYMYDKVVKAYRDRDNSFGNARYVVSIIDEAKLNMGLRIMKKPDLKKLKKKELSTISIEDIQKIFGTQAASRINIPVDENLLKEALNELNELTGLNNVKEEIIEQVKLVKYYKEIGKEVLNKFVLHTAFVGNPGTGKTTIARIIAKVFRALGILNRGHLVECDRPDLVAGYIGQTAIKTDKIINSAKGGVLFIDEAYALTQGGDQDFGKEAINTLLKRMEDFKDDFVVVVAGYPDNMDEFMKSNPGLKSRFNRTLIFEDYTTEELFEIAKLMLLKEDLTFSDKAANHIKTYLEYLYKGKDKYFGNAREVRKVIQESVKNQNLRMASMQSEKRTYEMIKTLELADVENFVPEKDFYKSKKIGY